LPVVQISGAILQVIDLVFNFVGVGVVDIERQGNAVD
jgi:hypothetical protein